MVETGAVHFGVFATLLSHGYGASRVDGSAAYSKPNQQPGRLPVQLRRPFQRAAMAMVSAHPRCVATTQRVDPRHRAVADQHQPTRFNLPTAQDRPPEACVLRSQVDDFGPCLPMSERICGNADWSHPCDAHHMGMKAGNADSHPTMTRTPPDSTQRLGLPAAPRALSRVWVIA